MQRVSPTRRTYRSWSFITLKVPLFGCAVRMTQEGHLDDHARQPCKKLRLTVPGKLVKRGFPLGRSGLTAVAILFPFWMHKKAIRKTIVF